MHDNFIILYQILITQVTIKKFYFLYNNLYNNLHFVENGKYYTGFTNRLQ